MLEKPIYRVVDGQPEMKDSFLAFLDILGYQSLIRAASRREELDDLLRRLHYALNGNLRVFGESDEPPWYAKSTFTDNIVLAVPVRPRPGDGEYELGRMMLDTASYQFGLAHHGFFVRGGVAVGLAFVDETTVFGPALIEAYDIESKQAIYPRVVLSEKVMMAVVHHVGYYRGGAATAPHGNEILVDEDECWFINYLDSARLDSDPDLLPSYRPFVDTHRRSVLTNLDHHSSSQRVRPKYEWLAAYHDYVCSYLYPGDSGLLTNVTYPARGFRRLWEVLPPDKFGLGVKRQDG